jgi:hypothetical protein
MMSQFRMEEMSEPSDNTDVGVTMTRGKTMTHPVAGNDRAYVPPRLEVLGSVRVLTQSLKQIGLGDAILFHHTQGGGGGVSNSS